MTFSQSRKTKPIQTQLVAASCPVEASAKTEAPGEAGSNPTCSELVCPELVEGVEPIPPQKKLPEHSFTELPEARHG